jgi:hypothetical protein
MRSTPAAAISRTLLGHTACWVVRAQRPAHWCCVGAMPFCECCATSCSLTVPSVSATRLGTPALLDPCR